MKPMRELRWLNTGITYRILVKISYDGKAGFSSRSRATCKQVETVVSFQRTMQIGCKLSHVEISVTGIHVTTIEETEMNVWAESWQIQAVMCGWGFIISMSDSGAESKIWWNKIKMERKMMGKRNRISLETALM